MLTHTPAVVDERQGPCEGYEFAHAPRQSLSTCSVADPHRAEAEAFVRARFHRTHGAHVVTFMPLLLLLRDSRGRIEAVAGCRLAELEPLFLERYLARPIEQEISAQTGARVHRSRIVEVGNFAATSSRVASRFMSFLAPRLLERELTWIAFTATHSIRRILASLGARCADLGAAEGVQAAKGPDCWGRYYSHDPRVMAGYLPMARSIPTLWKTCHAD